MMNWELEENWGKRDPNNYFDDCGTFCDDDKPHPRHYFRGFNGVDHNTTDILCLGRPKRDTYN